MKIKRMAFSVLSCFALVASSLPSTAVFVSADDNGASTPQFVTIEAKNGGNSHQAVFANGTPITVTYDTSSQTNTVTYQGGTISNVPTSADIFAGSHNSDRDIEEVSITIDGARLKTVYGGGLHKSHVKNVNITVQNSAEVKWVCGGGANALIHDTTCNETQDAWHSSNLGEKSSTQVDNAVITVENSTVSQAVFGGGQGYSYTKKSEINIKSGTIDTVCASGSNGCTDESTVNIEGGTITNVQSVVRGTMKDADINVSGGTVTNLYIGADDDTSDNGTISSVNVTIGAKANVANFKPGTSGNQPIGSEEGAETDYTFSVHPDATVSNYDGVLKEEKDTNNSYYYFTAYGKSGETATNEDATKLTNIVSTKSTSNGKAYQHAYVMANGVTVVATDENGDDGKWKATKIKCNDGSYVLTNYDAIHLFGGSHNSDQKVETTDVTLDGTTHVQTVWGGGWHKSEVGTANVTVTGDTKVSGIQGGAANYFAGSNCNVSGCSGHNDSSNSSKACWKPTGSDTGTENYDVAGNARVGKAIVNIEGCSGTYTTPSGTEIETIVYGGGESYAYTGSVELNITGGDLSKSYVIASGSNGYTGDATVAVSGEDTVIGTLASGNRGTVGNVDITIKNGTINKLLVGADDNATVESTNVTVSGGAVKKVEFGKNGNSTINPNEEGNFKVVADGGKINDADYTASAVNCNHDKYSKAEEVAGTPATCVATGTYDYWKCGNCERYFATIEGDLKDVTNEEGSAVNDTAIVIPATGHVYGELIPEVAATCKDKGIKAHYECQREGCGKKFVDEQGDSDVVTKKEVTDEELEIEINPLNHTNIVTDKAVESTCTAAGKTEGSHCEDCEAIIVPQFPTLLKEHTPVEDKAVEATCTDTGLTVGSHCSVCNGIIVMQVATPALGHEFLEANYKTDKEATCTENATQTAKCSRCTVTNTREVADSALNHPEDKREIIEGKDATCTAEGLTDGVKCTLCDAIIEEQAVIPVKEHTPVTDEAVAATCTSPGLTEGSHCSECGAQIVAQLATPMIPHTPVVDAAVDPTCTDFGLSEGSHCEVCGGVIVAQVLLPAKGHTYKNGACTVCGAKDPSVVVTTTVKPDKTTSKTPTKIQKLKVTSKSKKKINVLWTKVKGVAGYQVEVSTSKTFKASGKILTKTTNKLKLTIKNSKIKSNKKYYVRVRTYATYKDSKGVTKKVYSKWNKKLRKVTVK